MMGGIQGTTKVHTAGRSHLVKRTGLVLEKQFCLDKDEYKFANCERIGCVMVDSGENNGL